MIKQSREKDQIRVIAIDPAPGKPSTVFQGREFPRLSTIQLRDYLEQIAGLSVGILANRATKNISVVQLRQFLMERTTNAVDQLKQFAAE